MEYIYCESPVFLINVRWSDYTDNQFDQLHVLEGFSD